MLVRSIQKIYNSHISKNIIARIFAFGINFAYQLLLIPFFISNWGTEKYADWVVISSVIGFFILSDFGFNEVISNRFIIEYQKNNSFFCNKLIINNYLLLFLVTVALFVCFLLISGNQSLLFFFKLRSIDFNEFHKIILLLIIQVVIHQYSTVLNAIYKAKEKSYIAFLLDDSARLLEIIIIIIGVLLHQNFVVLCMLLIIPKLMIWIFKIIDTRKYYHQQYSLNLIDFSLIKDFIKPSLAFMAYPIGYALLNQGFIFLVNNKFSAETLILFNTSRSLVNIVKSTIGILLVSLWPAMSIAYGKSDFIKLKKLNKIAIQSGIVISVVIGIVILLSGKYIYFLWLPTIKYDGMLVMIMVLSMFFGNLWYTSSLVLMATNKHNKVSLYFFIFCVLSLSFGYILNLNFQSIYYLALCLLILDIPLSFFVILKNSSFLNEKIYNLFKINIYDLYRKNKA